MPHPIFISPRPVRGVLIDLSGVLYDGDAPLPGAIEAVQRLHHAGLGVRYLTNTTRSTRDQLLSKLRAMGFAIEPNEVFSAPLAAKRLIQQRGFRPMLLVHPNLEPEFADVLQDFPNAVVVGDAGHEITYEKLNAAFRLLMGDAALVALARNRYFKEADGLSLDAGPFVAALEFASGAKAQVVGKPSKEFFKLALDDLRCLAVDAVMIGDDVHDDVLGATAAKMRGILVRTGKYRPSDEQLLTDQRNAMVVDDFPAAVAVLLESISR